jgi:peptidase M28-like protein
MSGSSTSQVTAASQPRAGAAVFASVFTTLLICLALYQLTPPAVVPASAPPNEFSAMRALALLRVIATKPHPTGSPENAKVRDYLLGQLRGLGLESQVQTATAARHDPKWRGPASAATVNDLVARLPGTAPAKSVMLVAHYDSVPTGPGASDDGSGVITILETARALKAGPPLLNDVIFLLTDGEELGLLGAQAFVDEPPWAKDVGVVLNFEARGSCGPTFMFETSAPNGWLVREFARAAPVPVASSFMYEAYKRLPNDTDLTVFKRAGLAGLNFAYVGCWPRYHTWEDDVAHIAPRGLQHDGSYALALARHFGNLIPPTHDRTAGEDVVYFTLFHFTLRYSRVWAVPLMILTLIVFTSVVALGFQNRQLSWQGIALGFAGWLAGALVAAAGSQFLWVVLRGTRWVSRLPYGMAYNGDPYALGCIALTVAVISAVYALMGPRTSLGNLTVGALLWWVILTVLTSLYAPGGSYLFTWPALASLIELGYALARKHSESEVGILMAWTLPAVVGILLFAPLPYEVLMLVSTSGLVLITAAVALLLGFLAPYLHLMTARRKWWLAEAAGLASLVFFAAGVLESGYDSQHPRADSIFYALNADSGKALWVSIDSSPDEWTSQFLTGAVEQGVMSEFTFGKRPVLKAPAPSLQLDAPHVATMDDVTIGEVRILRLWVASPRHARALWIEIQNAKVLEADVNGKQVGDARSGSGVENWGLVYTGLPKEGIVLTLKVPAPQKPMLKVCDFSDGLPEIPGHSFRRRPEYLMPSPLLRYDSSTLVTRTFRLDTQP